MYPKQPRSPSGATSPDLCARLPRSHHSLTAGGCDQHLPEELAGGLSRSASDENLVSPRNICHGEKYSQFNGYGWDLLENGYSFSAIEPLNSDSDPNGATNLQEINANTQPGWTEGASNLINGGLVSGAALPAELLAGTVDMAAGNLPTLAASTAAAC